MSSWIRQLLCLTPGIPTPSEAMEREPTTQELVEETLNHIRVALFQRYTGRPIEVEAVGLDIDGQGMVIQALKSKGWWVDWTVGPWPARISTKATIRRAK